MVLRHTSTSVGTLLRGIAAAVRVRAIRPMERAVRLRATVVRTIEAATRPALHGAAVRHMSSSTHSAASYSPRFVNYGNTAKTFARAGYRPSARTPRGPAVPATVGLGKARTFATAPAQGTFQSGANNVPVVLRAFAQLIDDDNLPRPTRYSPYVRTSRKRTSGARGLRAPRRKSNASTCSIKSTASQSAILRELGHYFPVIIEETEVALPPRPEELVTPGYTATLALPLSPSLNALLEPANVPYADTEIGVAILAQLTDGILPLHEAYAAAGARVISLLARLEALGVLDINTYPTTTLDVAMNHRGEPDILRIIFSGRSVSDVRALLADQLDEWCALSHVKHMLVPVDEAASHWDEPRRVSSPGIITDSTTSVDLQLVMPTLDLSVAPTVMPSIYDHELESNASWPASPASLRSSPSESGLSTPYSADDWGTSASSASPASLIASLEALSDLSDADSWERTREWLSPPSETDSDLDAWSDAGHAHAQHEAEEVEIFWVGGGLSLTNAW